MIEVEDLRLTYPGAAGETLRGLDFAIAPGEVFGFLGPSGAGKSTTQKVLIGLLPDFGGAARVLGRPIRDWGSALYQQIGIAFENPNDHYLKLTARENLEFFASLYRGPTRDPAEALAELGLEADADRPVAEFSKGMRVRLNLARATLHRPGLVFLDEPTSGLDPRNAHNVKQMIRRWRDEGVTVFLTTHDMAVADEVCDRVAFLVDGAIAALDSPRSLRLRHGRRTVRVEVGHGDGDGRASHEFPLDGLADNPAFLDLLRRDDLQTIHTQETTLEAIFLEVTGRALA